VKFIQNVLVQWRAVDAAVWILLKVYGDVFSFQIIQTRQSSLLQVIRVRVRVGTSYLQGVSEVRVVKSK
jgi:hypothetical protein